MMLTMTGIDLLEDPRGEEEGRMEAGVWCWRGWVRWCCEDVLDSTYMYRSHTYVNASCHTL